jgi:multiple sugar transport system substrate-binding protein
MNAISFNKSLCVLCILCVLDVATHASDEPLVTPVRIGHPDAPLTLTVWAQQDYSHLAARPAIRDAFIATLNQWAVNHSDQQLRVSVMPALELHKAKLQLAAEADRLPDVASIDSFWMPLFMSGGHLQPLNDEWPAEDRQDFLPFTISTLSDRGGRVYGVWHETDCRVLFYRKDLVPVPPRTWAELIRDASRIARDRGIAGYLYNAGRWEATVFDHLAMFWAQGGELVDAEGRPVFGEPPQRQKMLRLLEFLRETIRSGASPSSVLASTDYQQLTAAAIAGDVAMFLGGNWQLNDLRAGLSPEKFANWDIAPIPQADAGTESSGTGGWVWVVFARDPVRRRAAIDFILSVEARDSAARISMATGHLPVRRSVYREYRFFSEDRWYQRFGRILASGRARPIVPVYPAISQALQVAIGDVVSGAATPDAALDAASAAARGEFARRSRLAAVARSAEAGGFDPLAWLPAAAALSAVVLVLWRITREDRELALWLAPGVALVATLLFYPMLELVRLALANSGTGAAASRYSLTGIRTLVLDPQFGRMLGITLVFVVASVLLQLALGIAIAWLIDAAGRRRIRGTLAARVAVVGAWVMPGVLVGIIWKILLIENRSGIVTFYLTRLGIRPLPLVSSAGFALLSVIAANVWRGCAFSMVLQYAGLQRIPRERHEAADLEGVSAWQRLRWVMLPELAPVIAVNAILITIATFNTFDLIMPLTGGGPARATEVMSLFMYRAAFFDLDGTKAAAVAVVMLAINVGLALAAARLVRRSSSG